MLRLISNKMSLIAIPVLVLLCMPARAERPRPGGLWDANPVEFAQFLIEQDLVDKCIFGGHLDIQRSPCGSFNPWQLTDSSWESTWPRFFDEEPKGFFSCDIDGQRVFASGDIDFHYNRIHETHHALGCAQGISYDSTWDEEYRILSRHFADTPCGCRIRSFMTPQQLQSAGEYYKLALSVRGSSLAEQVRVNELIYPKTPAAEQARLCTKPGCFPNGGAPSRSSCSTGCFDKLALGCLGPAFAWNVACERNGVRTPDQYVCDTVGVTPIVNKIATIKPECEKINLVKPIDAYARSSGSIWANPNAKPCKAHPGFLPVCLPPSTNIATTDGDIEVQNLREGDFVRLPGRADAKILKISRNPIPYRHQMVVVKLKDGRTFQASPGHPLIDGAPIESLKVGDKYAGSNVVSMELKKFRGQYAYDLYLDSDTQAYIADGVPMGSTFSKDGATSCR